MLSNILRFRIVKILLETELLFALKSDGKFKERKKKNNFKYINKIFRKTVCQWF